MINETLNIDMTTTIKLILIMSLTDELIVSSLIEEATFYHNHRDENETYLLLSQKRIERIDEILKKNIR